MAGITFNWEYNYPYADEVEFRLYEDNVPIVDNIGQLSYSITMNGKDYKSYDYYVTAVRNGLESAPSNTVTVNFTLPEVPTNLIFGWAG